MVQAMTKATERVKSGRRARLRAEVYHRIQNLPVNYSCVYKRPEQSAQYFRGWNSVSQIDIDVAVNRVQNSQPKVIQSTSLKTTKPSLKTLFKKLKGNVPCQSSQH